MSVLSKAGLTSAVSATFLDNTTGSVTPTIVRTQQNNLVDSLLSQVVPGTGAATGSLVYWSGSSTTAQLILGTTGSILQPIGGVPTWTQTPTIITPSGGGGLTITNASVDNALLILSGSTHQVQLLDDNNGGTLKVVTAGVLQFGTSNATRLTITATGAAVFSHAAQILSPTGALTIVTSTTDAALLQLQGTTSTFQVVEDGAGATIKLTSSGRIAFGVSNADRWTIGPTGALFAAGVSGGAQGSGTLNATGLFQQGSQVTSVGLAAVGQIPGITTGVAASSGNIGEIVFASVAAVSGFAATNAVAANAASISLGAGDWDLWGTLSLSVTASHSMTLLQGAVSPSSATIPSLTTNTSRILLAQQFNATGLSHIISVPPTSITVSTTTTYYLVGNIQFSAGSATVGGFLQGRRVR